MTADQDRASVIREAIVTAQWPDVTSKVTDMLAAVIVAALGEQPVGSTERAAVEVVAAVEAIYPPYNCELRPDGSEDPVAAAYVEAFRDVDRVLDQFRPAGGTDIFHLYQPPIAGSAMEVAEHEVESALHAVLGRLTQPVPNPPTSAVARVEGATELPRNSDPTSAEALPCDGWESCPNHGAHPTSAVRGTEGAKGCVCDAPDYGFNGLWCNVHPNPPTAGEGCRSLAECRDPDSCGAPQVCFPSRDTEGAEG